MGQVRFSAALIEWAAGGGEFREIETDGRCVKQHRTKRGTNWSPRARN
jgi:hypothetical protein